MGQFFQKGLEVLIYKDYENQKDLIGKGILIEKAEEGLPFIIDDVDEEGNFIPANQQQVFS